MNCTVKPTKLTFLHGSPEEYTKDMLELTWSTSGKKMTTYHEDFEEVKQKIQEHIDNKELYELEDKAIEAWYENNRKNGSNWTGD